MAIIKVDLQKSYPKPRRDHARITLAGAMSLWAFRPALSFPSDGLLRPQGLLLGRLSRRFEVLAQAVEGVDTADLRAPEAARFAPTSREIGRASCRERV